MAKSVLPSVTIQTFLTACQLFSLVQRLRYAHHFNGTANVLTGEQYMGKF